MSTSAAARRRAPGPRPRCHAGVGLEHVVELALDGQHRVERVHRALEHHRHLAPAELPAEPRSSRASTSRPSSRIWLPGMRAGGRCRRLMAKAMVLLPQPDSPARPKNSPASDVEADILDGTEIGLGADVVDREVADREGGAGVSTLPPRRSGMIAAGPAGEHAAGAQARIGDLVDGEVDEREAEPEHGQRDAGRQQVPPGADRERRGVLRVVEHDAPGDGVRVAQARGTPASPR